MAGPPGSAGGYSTLLRHPAPLRDDGGDAPRGFTPDPGRLYEVGRDGTPYTLAPLDPDAEAATERRARRWWVAAVLLNALAMGLAAAAVLGPRSGAAWAGLLPLLSAPLLAVPLAIRSKGRRQTRRVHRTRPDAFPPP